MQVAEDSFELVHGRLRAAYQCALGRLFYGCVMLVDGLTLLHLQDLVIDDLLFSRPCGLRACKVAVRLRLGIRCRLCLVPLLPVI